MCQSMSGKADIPYAKIILKTLVPWQFLIVTHGKKSEVHNL